MFQDWDAETNNHARLCICMVHVFCLKAVGTVFILAVQGTLEGAVHEGADWQATLLLLVSLHHHQ